MTSVDHLLPRDLGAAPQESVEIYTVAGGSTAGDYAATISLQDALTGQTYALSGGAIGGLGDTLQGRVRVLIGWDIQQHYRLVADGPASLWRIYGPSGAQVATVPARRALAGDIVAVVAGAALTATGSATSVNVV